MMADYLSNLLLRSTGDPSAVAVLQPRLPSLFEPLHRAEEIPLPPPDPVVREAVIPAAEPSTTGIPQNMLHSSSSTIMVERKMPDIVSNGNQSTVFQKAVPPPGQETGRIAGQQIQASESRSHLEKPLRTIFRDDGHKSSADAKPLIKEDFSFKLDKQTPRAESVSPQVRVAEEVSLPTKPEKNAPELGTRSPKADPVAEIEVRPLRASSPISSASQSMTTIRPILPEVYPARRRQLDPPQVQARVVEIHIGRVEVRATPAPAVHPKTKPRSAPIMTLDEYLQQRKAGER